MTTIEILKDLYDAYARGDVHAVLGAMDETMAWSEAEGNPYRPAEGALIGPESIMQDLMVKLAGDWSDFTVTPQRFHGGGEVVITQGRYTGIYKSTGKSLDAQFCHVWKLIDGKLTAFQQYTDTGQWQSVMTN